VSAGRIRWVLASAGGGGSPFGGGRVGATKAMAAVRSACVAVSGQTDLYDCAGRAPQLRAQ
jgi:hypothetical protein